MRRIIICVAHVPIGSDGEFLNFFFIFLPFPPLPSPDKHSEAQFDQVAACAAERLGDSNFFPFFCFIFIFFPDKYSEAEFDLGAARAGWG